MANTIFVAHRGYSSRAPENSGPAFAEAAARGFGGIECDIWEARRDGHGPELMVMHDENLSRMCGVNVRITRLTRRELGEYPIIKGKNIKKYGGVLPIPAFEEYLDILAAGTAVPVIEIKSREPEDEENAIPEDTAKHLIDQVRQRLPGRPVVLQSFNLHSLYRLRPYLGERMELLYLVKKAERIKSEKLNAYKENGITGISAKYTVLSSASISRIHHAGLKVAVWTVNSRILAQKLAAADRVEYIISNKAVFKG